MDIEEQAHQSRLYKTLAKGINCAGNSISSGIIVGAIILGGIGSCRQGYTLKHEYVDPLEVSRLQEDNQELQRNYRELQREHKELETRIEALEKD